MLRRYVKSSNVSYSKWMKRKNLWSFSQFFFATISISGLGISTYINTLLFAHPFLRIAVAKRSIFYVNGISPPAEEKVLPMAYASAPTEEGIPRWLYSKVRQKWGCFRRNWWTNLCSVVTSSIWARIAHVGTRCWIMSGLGWLFLWRKRLSNLRTCILTEKYQPLDVAVNCQFKIHYREVYQKWRKHHQEVTAVGLLLKPGRQRFYEYGLCCLG